MIDWSGVELNAHGCPLGFIRLTTSAVPGQPFLVRAAAILAAEQDGPNTVVNFGVGRVAVKENIRDVFRMRAEADTVESAKPVSPPKLFSPEPTSNVATIPGMNTNKPDRVRKK